MTTPIRFTFVNIEGGAVAVHKPGCAAAKREAAHPSFIGDVTLPATVKTPQDFIDYLNADEDGDGFVLGEDYELRPCAEAMLGGKR